MSVVSIYGGVGTRKSSLAATWPGKRGWLDLEAGAMRALYRIPNWKEDNELWHPLNDGLETALISTISHSRGKSVSGYVELYNATTAKYIEFLKDNSIKTIIIDTWKEFWKSNTQEYLQEVQETANKKNEVPRKNLIQIEYATPNTRMSGVIQLANAFKKNLILISHERDNIVNTLDSNGRSAFIKQGVELDGWRQTDSLADWSFYTYIDKDEKTGIKTYQAVVIKSPVGQDMLSQVFIDPTWMSFYERVKALQLEWY